MDDNGKHGDELEALDERIRQLQERADSLSSKPRTDNLEFDRHFDSRLSELQTKAQTVKSIRDSQQRDAERIQQRDNESGRGLGIGLTVAYMILGLPMFGAGVGWLIDRQVGGKFWIGVCTLMGAVLGLTLAIMTINKADAPKK